MSSHRYILVLSVSSMYDKVCALQKRAQKAAKSTLSQSIG